MIKPLPVPLDSITPAIRKRVIALKLARVGQRVILDELEADGIRAYHLERIWREYRLATGTPAQRTGGMARKQGV
jgi:hypothetical protein